MVKRAFRDLFLLALTGDGLCNRFHCVGRRSGAFPMWKHFPLKMLYGILKRTASKVPKLRPIVPLIAVKHLEEWYWQEKI